MSTDTPGTSGTQGTETYGGGAGTYLDPALTAALARDPSALDLRTTRAAVVFWDISGYSRIADALQYDRTTELLGNIGEFLTGAVLAVQRNHGIVHKFLGDGLIAVFGSSLGAPAAATATAGNRPDSALARPALTAAAELRAEFPQMADRWVASSGAPDPRIWQVGLRCGIAIGDVHHGRLGLGPMSALALLGHAVNLASRCCAGAEPGQVLVSERVRAAGVTAFGFRPAGPPRVLKHISGAQQLWAAGAPHREAR
ncbi:adenylate/guanylate cyclase domain-containing protein [Streptomyces sp. NPDC032472]|uniref:adenylate/guanylate cyclase domain-containing protein n=1 Tax=Streptomyces sp. NPDC032472 TaxID=3155018 RepID=UPI0033FCEDB8